jgi:hypothetical protein
MRLCIWSCDCASANKRRISPVNSWPSPAPGSPLEEEVRPKPVLDYWIVTWLGWVS